MNDLDKLLELQDKVRAYLEIKGGSADNVSVHLLDYRETPSILLRGCYGSEGDGYDGSTDHYEEYEEEVPLDFFENYHEYYSNAKDAEKERRRIICENSEAKRVDHEKRQLETLLKKYPEMARGVSE